MLTVHYGENVPLLFHSQGGEEWIHVLAGSAYVQTLGSTPLTVVLQQYDAHLVRANTCHRIVRTQDAIVLVVSRQRKTPATLASVYAHRNLSSPQPELFSQNGNKQEALDPLDSVELPCVCGAAAWQQQWMCADY